MILMVSERGGALMQATSLGVRQTPKLENLYPVSAMARCVRCRKWRECRPLPEARGWLCVKRCYPSALKTEGARRLLEAVQGSDSENGATAMRVGQT